MNRDESIEARLSRLVPAGVEPAGCEFVGRVRRRGRRRVAARAALLAASVVVAWGSWWMVSRPPRPGPRPAPVALAGVEGESLAVLRRADPDRIDLRRGRAGAAGSGVGRWPAERLTAELAGG